MVANPGTQDDDVVLTRGPEPRTLDTPDPCTDVNVSASRRADTRRATTTDIEDEPSPLQSEADMPKYALFFTYTPDAWDAMVANPRDRAAQARAIVEAADGTMEAVYWMFGPHDGICLFDAPSPISAGAISVAVGSTGTFKHLETHELLTQDQLTELLATARECRRRYEPPGHPRTSP